MCLFAQSSWQILDADSRELYETLEVQHIEHRRLEQTFVEV